MNAVLKPIALGTLAYVVSAVGLWFVVSYALFPVIPDAIWLLPAAVTLVPLFLAGFVAARFTGSNHRSRKIVFGVIAGLFGFGVSLFITKAQGEVWFFLVLILGAATVAGLGGLMGTRERRAL